MSEEVTDYTIDDLGKILAEAMENMPSMIRCKDSRDVFGTESDFIYVGYQAVVDLAAEINRHGNWEYADAIEMAFDSLLAAGNGRQFKRVGEVILLKEEQVANAYCVRKEQDAS